MPRPSLALLLLSSCDAGPSREVSVVTGDAEAPVAEWRPQDTASTESPLVTQECGAASAQAEEGDLALLSCARVSPEPEGEQEADTTLDTGLSGSTGGGPDTPPPPCGFFNLVGAVALSGTPSSPTLLYCDADLDGGLRRVAITPASGAFESELLAPEVCWVDLQSGGELATDDETLLFWADLAPSGHAGVSTMVYVAPATAAPPITDAAWVLEGTENTLGLRVLGGENPGLVVADMDGGVRLLLLRPDAGAVTDSVEIAEAGASFDAAVSGGIAAIATCVTDSELDVVSVDLSSATTLWSHTITDARCSWGAIPGVVVKDGRVAVVWDDGDRGWLATLDDKGQELGITSFGKDSYHPAIAVQGDNLVTVDASGQVGLWSWDGVSLGAWTHRMIADRPGDTQGFQLLADEDALTFLLVGMDYVSTGTGHINTYYYLETSTSAALTP